MSGRKLLLKYFNSIRIAKGEISMDIGAYFELLKYVLMAATFVVLVLVFLHMFYGKEEKED
jgi:hypothetical protein